MKILGYTCLFIVVCFMSLCLRPVPSVTTENVMIQKGIVEDITEGGVKDATFHLVDDDRYFYINRGLENRFKLEDLRKHLIGKEVTLVYADHWTPLDWDNKSIHIARLEIGEDVFYDETRTLIK